MKDDQGLVEPASPPTREALKQAVGLRQLYRWFAPWVSGLLLVTAALLGLFTASSALGAGNFDAGLSTFGLAIFALARGIKNYLDGGSTVLWSPALVEDTDSLLLLVFLLAALATLGLVLAARARESVWQDIGYALFGTSLAMIASNLKHYFDWRERNQDRGDSC
ncbi:MAG TPA: hypothetical protein VF502_01140 [Stellaceae bacterium]